MTAKNFRCLPGSTLKLIAAVCMLIDHTAFCIIYYDILLPQAPIVEGSPVYKWYVLYKVMRTIGRLAFPIYCFLLIEGFVYTSNRRKYALRLFLFALISEFPFDLALFQTPVTWEYQNVYFTLLIGFVTVWGMEAVRERKYYLYLQVGIVLAGCLVAYVLHTDYDYKGIILIMLLYYFRFQPSVRTLAGCISLLWEPAACLAFIPINMYNGKRGLPVKYMFYIFYPLHLLILGIFSCIIT
ncbi:MAG: TraX family protein [Oliverpabstia sp.]